MSSRSARITSASRRTASEWSAAGEADALEHAAAVRIEGTARVEHGLVVPVHDVAHRPAVSVAKAILLEMRAQLGDQLRAFLRGEPHDLDFGGRVEVQDPLAAVRVRAHERVREDGA